MGRTVLEKALQAEQQQHHLWAWRRVTDSNKRGPRLGMGVWGAGREKLWLLPYKALSNTTCRLEEKILYGSPGKRGTYQGKGGRTENGFFHSKGVSPS